MTAMLDLYKANVPCVVGAVPFVQSITWSGSSTEYLTVMPAAGKEIWVERISFGLSSTFDFFNTAANKIDIAASISGGFPLNHQFATIRMLQAFCNGNNATMGNQGMLSKEFCPPLRLRASDSDYLYVMNDAGLTPTPPLTGSMVIMMHGWIIEESAYSAGEILGYYQRAIPRGSLFTEIMSWRNIGGNNTPTLTITPSGGKLCMVSRIGFALTSDCAILDGTNIIKIHPLGVEGGDITTINDLMELQAFCTGNNDATVGDQDKLVKVFTPPIMVKNSLSQVFTISNDAGLAGSVGGSQELAFAVHGWTLNEATY